MEYDIVGGNFEPFWAGFPLTDIHRCIAPDVLHQLYQGVLKHLVSWVQKVVGEEALDERIKRLPPAPGVRRFPKGISNLAQVSGTERKHISSILLACLNGKMDARGIMACRSILHFVQLAQYPSHDKHTLGYMTEELNAWHKYRDYFISKDIRSHFNIPKFHSLLHYVDSIKWIGTTDNTNTEAFERLHIDLAKEGWRSSNKRDHFPQMISFISQKKGSSSILINIAKYPKEPRKKLEAIALLHGAPGFIGELKLFLNDLPLNFATLEVWHNFGLTPLKVLDVSEKELIKAQPISIREKASRFDTVLVMENERAQSTAVQGCRVGRLRVVFRLPLTLIKNGFQVKVPAHWPQEHLGYVTWFTRFKPSPDPATGMYRVEPSISSNGIPHGAIIPLSDIRQSCMLVPGKSSWDRSWNSDNILDECSSFFVNNLQSKYSYQTIY
ncbi:hypothetical protein EV360DRAFT_53021 [Lentinula raphanica]|nr:hypothetical protein EV360DRAFT_53021 [Lentinula raphanica]